MNEEWVGQQKTVAIKRLRIWGVRRVTWLKIVNKFIFQEWFIKIILKKLRSSKWLLRTIFNFTCIHAWASCKIEERVGISTAQKKIGFAGNANWNAKRDDDKWRVWARGKTE